MRESAQELRQFRKIYWIRFSTKERFDKRGSFEEKLWSKLVEAVAPE